MLLFSVKPGTFYRAVFFGYELFLNYLLPRTAPSDLLVCCPEDFHSLAVSGNPHPLD